MRVRGNKVNQASSALNKDQLVFGKLEEMDESLQKTSAGSNFVKG